MDLARRSPFLRLGFDVLDLGLFACVSPTAVRVYQVLRRFIWRNASNGDNLLLCLSEDGKLAARVSREKLGAYVGLSPSRISALLRELRELGWIEIAPSSAGRTNVYILGFWEGDSRGPDEANYVETLYSEVWLRNLAEELDKQRPRVLKHPMRWSKQDKKRLDEEKLPRLWSDWDQIPMDVRMEFARTFTENGEADLVEIYRDHCRDNYTPTPGHPRWLPIEEVGPYLEQFESEAKHDHKAGRPFDVEDLKRQLLEELQLLEQEETSTGASEEAPEVGVKLSAEDLAILGVFKPPTEESQATPDSSEPATQSCEDQDLAGPGSSNPDQPEAGARIYNREQRTREYKKDCAKALAAAPLAGEAELSEQESSRKSESALPEDVDGTQAPTPPKSPSPPPKKPGELDRDEEGLPKNDGRFPEALQVLVEGRRRAIRKRREAEAKRRRRRQRKAENARGRGKRKSKYKEFAQTWRIAMAEHYPKVMVSDWGATEYGKIKHVVESFGPAKTKLAIEYFVSNWAALSEKRFDGVGPIPSLGFFVAMRDVFVNEAVLWKSVRDVQKEHREFKANNSKYVTMPKDLAERWKEAQKVLKKLGLDA